MASSASNHPFHPMSSPVVEMPRRTRSRKIWYWIGGILLVVIVGLAIAAKVVIDRAEPILRARVIETLEARFKSKVELTAMHVSIADGLKVSGDGLKIFGQKDANPTAGGVQPLIAVKEFSFSTGISTLFRTPMHISVVHVKGLSLNIPPKEDRQEFKNTLHSGNDENKSDSKTDEGKTKIIVDELLMDDTQLVINTYKPGKIPLDFEISKLEMKDVGPGQPMPFDATLVNPKPIGDIKSTGHFGPFNTENPRDTPLDGEYSFTNADLGTLKGIAGILSSTGKYHGALGRIEADGSTETPDFRVNISGHPVPLHCDFHAIIDGTDGDTYLQPVKARFLNSEFTAEGKVVRVKGKGHDIQLNVVMTKARIEDLLRLGVKTDPPIMSGPVTMKTKLGLPPTHEDMIDRLDLDGEFHIPQGQFSNDKIQDKIDQLSLRSQGKPKMAQEHVDVNVPSELQGKFHLRDGLLDFPSLHFKIPGTHADIDGTYSLDGNQFDFHGKLKLDAKLSQMMTGWKSILLKPVDPFFAKNGAGTEVPFKVTGTKSEPHFGLDFGHKDDKDDTKKGDNKKDEARKEKP